MTHYIDGATQKAAFHNVRAASMQQRTSALTHSLPRSTSLGCGPPQTIFIIISDIGVGKLTGLVAADGDQVHVDRKGAHGKQLLETKCRTDSDCTV